MLWFVENYPVTLYPPHDLQLYFSTHETNIFKENLSIYLECRLNKICLSQRNIKFKKYLNNFYVYPTLDFQKLL